MLCVYFYKIRYRLILLNVATVILLFSRIFFSQKHCLPYIYRICQKSSDALGLKWSPDAFGLKLSLDALGLQLSAYAF